MSKKVLVLLASGFEEIEAVSVIDVMRRGGLEVLVAGVDGLMLTGANGIIIKADAMLMAVNAGKYDAVVLPGGYGGTMKLCEDEVAQKVIKEFDAMGKIVAAICAAPIALDRAGVLKDEYTCYPGCEEGIKSSKFIEKTVVESKNVITSRGPGTAICFGLYLVEKLAGKESALSVKEGMLASYC